MSLYGITLTGETVERLDKPVPLLLCPPQSQMESTGIKPEPPKWYLF